MEGAGFNLLLVKWALRTSGRRPGRSRALDVVGGGEDQFWRDCRAGAFVRCAVRGVVGTCLDEVHEAVDGNELEGGYPNDDPHAAAEQVWKERKGQESEGEYPHREWASCGFHMQDAEGLAYEPTELNLVFGAWTPGPPIAAEVGDEVAQGGRR